MSESAVNNKRKRKKSFLKNARKYAKKGCYGRGSQLDADTYQYFVRVMEVYREGFPSPDEKRIFVNNVFEQTEGNEVDCCCNQVGCRVVEMLLPFASESVVLRFMDKMGEDLRRLCCDRFASHVLEALVKEGCRRSYDAGIDEELKDKLKIFVLKISRFMLNNLEDFVWDTYANFIMRAVIVNLADLSEENGSNIKDINEEFIEIIKDYGERMISWPQFKDLPYSEITSAFLQTLLKALQKCCPQLLKKYLKKLLEECFTVKSNENTDSLPEVFLSKPALMLMETALQVANTKMFSKIHAKCFASNLSTLAELRSTNFAVQKLLTHCQEKSEFEGMFDELQGNFKAILDAGHSGVIHSLGQTCKRLSSKQGTYIQCLMKAFDCYEPIERQNALVCCLSRFINYEEIVKSKGENLQNVKLNLHGTLIVQLLLEFHKPIKIVNSILSMETEELKQLFSNSMGSHIADSFMKSTFVGEKSREKLFKKLQGTYQELASTKYGSRAFEAIWNVSSMKNRLTIMEELSYKDGSWSHSEFGKIISGKLNLILYKRSKEEWKNFVCKSDKLKQLLQVLD